MNAHLSRLEGMLVIGGLSLAAKLFDHLQINDLFKLSAVCHGMFVVTNFYIIDRFNVDNHLEHWVPKGSELRAVMLRSNAVVVGNGPLDLLQRRADRLPPSYPLDIFVEFRGARDIGLYLQRQGYMYRPVIKGISSFIQAFIHCPSQERLRRSSARDSPISVRYSPVLQEFSFIRKNGGSNASTVNIISLRISPIRHLLNCSQSKHLRQRTNCLLIISFTAAYMNMITATDTISLFPRATLIEGLSYDCTPVAIPAIRRQTRDITKTWIAQGNRRTAFELVKSSHTIGRTDETISRLRRFGDALSLVIPNGLDGFSCSFFLHDPQIITSLSFQI